MSEEEPSSAAAHDVLLREATAEEQDEKRLHQAQEILEQESQAEELLLEVSGAAAAPAAAPALTEPRRGHWGRALFDALLFAACFRAAAACALHPLLALPLAYCAVLASTRLRPGAHFQHCSLWTALAVAATTLVQVGSRGTELLAALVLAPLLLPRCLLWWPKAKAKAKAKADQQVRALAADYRQWLTAAKKGPATKRHTFSPS